MIDLSRGVAHNAAAIEGNGPVIIVTDQQQWAYAAAFPIDPSRFPNPEQTGVRLYARVQSGAIGVLAVGSDFTTTIATQAHAPAGWEGPIEIVLNRPLVSGWLVVRNNTPRGSSKLEITAVETFEPRDEPSPFLAWERLDDDAPDRSRELFDMLRRKWSEVPAGLMDRIRTAALAKLSDEELLQYWTFVHADASIGKGFQVRGWFHLIYSDMLRCKKVLDVGSGLGIDGLTLAKAGAKMTFVDIAPENLAVIRRLCGIFGLTEVDFLYLEDFNSLHKLSRDFDAIWCQGSMINAPFDFMRRESVLLLQHLPVGGRWIELCYPEERWRREGAAHFSKWGEITDGEGTPWMEWYDLERLLARMAPATFEPVLAFNFHNDDFNWFDLIRRS